MKAQLIKFICFSINLCLVTACHHGSDRNIATVPEWSKKAIWYQIFPERFRNGDPGNDPQWQDTHGAWPHDSERIWQVSPWTADWFKLQPWEKRSDKGFYYQVQRRRYGGDLQGVLEKLDYLNSLGINAIYFNPLFESPSLHKYDATCYHHIDDNFGPNPAADKVIIASEDPGRAKTWQWSHADRLFLELIKACHRRGIRLIIDGVFNHAGMTFWALQDVRIKGPQSRYADWFTITQWDNPDTPEDELRYACWNGARELPEFRKDENGLASGPADHIHAIVRRWMDPDGDGDPSDGIDGWRLDVAEKVPPAFWRQFRQWVRAINPEACLVGEVWWQDWQNNKMFDASPWLQGDQFDAVMNYRFAGVVTQTFIDKKNKTLISAFNDHLAEIRTHYPQENQYALMNLLDSHDVDRLASNIVNPDNLYDHWVNNHDNKDYNPRKPDAEQRKIQKLIAILQMTYMGAPMLYYGTEAGMWGGDDPDCRKPMIWEDLIYESERAMPDGSDRAPDSVIFDQDLFRFYQKLITIRKSNRALTDGDFNAMIVDDENDIFGFKRRFQDQVVLVLLNLASDLQPVQVECTESAHWQDLITNEEVEAAMGDLILTIPGKGARLLAARSMNDSF